MMNIFQVIPTELHLNGPNVGFSSMPVDASATITGVATFVAISTANFPYNNTNGSYTFDWYFGGENIKDTTVDPDSNAAIETDAAAGISTITINGLTDQDDGKSVFVVTNYKAGPDENIIDYPAEGIGNSTSGSATLSAASRIVITKQPTSQIVGAGNTASFEIEATAGPGGRNLTYQWSLEGQNLTNGTSSRTVQNSGNPFPTMEVTSDAGDNFTLDWQNLSTYSSFVSGRTYTLTVSGDLPAEIIMRGGDGGISLGRSVPGGGGGTTTGKMTFNAGKSYILRIGGKGGDGRSVFDPRRLRSFGAGGEAGYSGGGQGGGGNGVGGGGGGFTGIFFREITQSNSILIAGGGGGGANDPAEGGAGGGLSGNPGTNGPGRGGGGGSQTEGGGGGGNEGDNPRQNGTAGSALQGGSGSGGGGGGYFGGGGGQSLPFGAGDGAGGGGSSYIGGHPEAEVTEASTTVGTDGGGAELIDGNFRINRITTTKEITTTVLGAGTPNLTIFSNDEDFGGGVLCTLRATNVLESPVFSNTVSYDVVPARNFLNFEAFDTDNNYSSLNQDLDLSRTFTLTSDTFGSQYGIIQFHATEKDVDLRLNINAAAGASNLDTNGNTVSGGEGGTSTIDFTAKRDVEYTIIGVSNNSAVFLYEKSTLIAVVGQGGAAGTGGRGGPGGGINIAGGNGEGARRGAGASIPDSVILTGVFGSIANDYLTPPTLYRGDSIAEKPAGGRTISCSRGSYWVNQGIDACADISASEVKFTNIDGTEISDSSTLYRGFKAGYTVTDTKGAATDTRGGDGGAGVRGGNGSAETGGGGGGSGYSNGTATVVSANLGGNLTTKSSITFGLQNELDPVPAQTQTVNFTVVKKASAISGEVIFTLISGDGPSRITFGPDSATISANIARGSVYSLESADGRLRLSGNTLQLEDSRDNDFNDLQITPDRGNFQNTSTYIADF